MEKSSFESGPEKEGAVEDKISDIFNEWVGKGGYDVDELNEKLKSIPGAEARRVYRPTASREYYFLDNRQGPSTSYLVVSLDENRGDFLFPKPLGNGLFEAMKYAEVGGSEMESGTSLSFSSTAIKPVSLKRNGQRWEVDTQTKENVKHVEPVSYQKETVVVGNALERETNFEETVSRVFMEWQKEVERAESGYDDLVSKLKESLNTKEVYVSSLYSQTGLFEALFVEDRPQGSVRRYIKLTVEGEAWLLPYPIGPGSFDNLAFVQLVDRRTGSFDENHVMPIPLTHNGSAFTADVPGNKVLKDEDIWKFYNAKSRPAKDVAGEKDPSASNPPASAPSAESVEAEKPFALTPGEEERGIALLQEFYDLSDRKKVLEGKPPYGHNAESEWENYRSTFEEEGVFAETVSTWERDIAKLKEDIKKLEGKKGKAGSGVGGVDAVPVPAVSVENSVSVPAVGESSGGGSMKISDLTGDLPPMDDAVDPSPHGVDTAVEEEGALDKRKEAFLLYERFFELTKEINALKGLPVSDQTPKDSFEAEMEVMGDIPIEEYIRDLREDSIPKKEKELEELKAKSRIEKEKKTDTTTPAGGGFPLPDSALNVLGGVHIEGKNDPEVSGRKESTPDTKDKRPKDERLKLPLISDLASISDEDFVWGDKEVDEYTKLAKDSDDYNLKVFDTIIKKFIVPFSVNNLEVDGKVQPLLIFLTRVIMEEGGLNVPSLRSIGDVSEERKQFDDLKLMDGKHFKDFYLEKRDLLFILAKALKIVDERIVEAKKRKALKDSSEKDKKVPENDVKLAEILDTVGDLEQIDFVLDNGTVVQMSGQIARRRIENVIGQCREIVVQNPSDFERRQSLILSELDHFRANGEISDTLWGYFVGIGWIKKSNETKKEIKGGLEEDQAPSTDDSLEAEGLPRAENLDVRPALSLVTEYQGPAIEWNDDNVEEFASLDQGVINEKNFELISDIVKEGFIYPSIKGQCDNSNEEIEINAFLRRMVLLHDDNIKRREGNNPENFAKSRRPKIDGFKFAGRKFGDFAIERNALEAILQNAKAVLDRRIMEAKIRKDERDREKAKAVKGAGAGAPIPPKSSEGGTWTGGVSLTAEEARRETDIILAGQRRQPTSPRRERVPTRAETVPEDEGPEEVTVRREGIWHKWKGKIGVLVAGTLLALGVREELGKRSHDASDSSKKDHDATTNRIEHVEPVREEIKRLENSLTNFVSPQYLRGIKEADNLKNLLKDRPGMQGFEKLDTNLTDHLKFVWDDNNGFYPKGWTRGKFFVISYSTNAPLDDSSLNETTRNMSLGASSDKLTRSMTFFDNGTNGVKQLSVPNLNQIYTHQVSHANDWGGNWVFGEPGSTNLYEKRLTLLASVLDRVHQENRIHFPAVERITEGEHSGELKAEEYWASLCDMYFNYPKKLKAEHSEDYNIVHGFVQSLDEGFDPDVARMARYEVARNFGNKDVTLLQGGRVSMVDFQKKVVAGLKVRGNKGPNFNAFTETQN